VVSPVWFCCESLRLMTFIRWRRVMRIRKPAARFLRMHLPPLLSVHRTSMTKGGSRLNHEKVQIMARRFFKGPCVDIFAPGVDITSCETGVSPSVFDNLCKFGNDIVRLGYTRRKVWHIYGNDSQGKRPIISSRAHLFL
jgi:hypothetical protein